MTYLLFGLLDAFERGFIGVILILDTLIYGLISSAFRIFMAIAGARLLSSDAYTAIANKIYLVVGVLALFFISYAILKAIVNPDEGEKQVGGKFLKKLAIAVVGLAVTPALFNFMYQAQGIILEHDILAKLFFRSENTESFTSSGSIETDDGSQIDYNGTINPDDYVKNIGGAVTATTIWQAFFYPAEDSGKDATQIIADPGDYLAGAVGNSIGCAVSTAGVLITAYTGWTGWGAVIGLLTAGAGALFCTNAIADSEAYSQASKITTKEISLADAYVLTSSTSGVGNFGIYTVFLDNYIEDGEISYLFGISTLCGAFVLYAFATFSIDMGVRAAKLAYLQVIAPIPLLYQLLPGKDGKFNDYVKTVTNTFMEVFIRISVVYIVVYIICHLQDLFSSVDALWGNNELSTGELMFALAFLIIGLILFCKEAPGFLGKALGIDTGGMKLGLGWKDTQKKLGEGGVFNAAGIGYGGLTTGVRNFRKGIEDNKGFWGTLGSTVAGIGSGAARAAKSQMWGPGHKPSMNWHEARDAALRAADAATDKRDARDEREAALSKARQEMHDADRDLATKERELAAARASGDATRIANAQADLAEAEARVRAARNRFAEATAIGSAVVEAGRRIDTWSAGSVDTSYSDNLISLYGRMNDFKDKSRGVTAKDAAVQAAQMLKSQVDAETVSEYREEDYSRDVAAAVARAEADARAAGRTEEEIAEARARAIQSISKESYRRTDAELDAAREDLRRRQKAAKDNLEAAQDIAFKQLLAAGDEGAIRILEEFRSANMGDFKKYADELITINGREMSLGSYLESQLGINLTQGTLDTASITGKTNTVTVEIAGSPNATFEAVYDASGKNILHYVDVSGTYEDAHGHRNAAGATISVESFQRQTVERHGKASFSESPIVNVADAAKDARKAELSNPKRQKAKDRQRQADEAKSGKK